MTEYIIEKPVAYLMLIKCDAVGRHISSISGRTVRKGDLIAYLTLPEKNCSTPALID